MLLPRLILGCVLWSSCALCLCPASSAQNKNSAKQNSRDASAARADTEDASSSTSAPREPAGGEAEGAAIAYEYEFNQPDFYISRVIIEHDAGGRGKITFKRRADAEGFTEPLQLSPATLARVSANWEALNFLSSQESYQAGKQFPHLGTMQLRMKRGTEARSAEFNWTNNKQVSALVDEYRRIGDQAIFIFDITVARENQPLEAPKIMDRLDILITRNGISDAQQLVPLLQDLAADERIPLMARNHADRLLKKIDKAKKKD